MNTWQQQAHNRIDSQNADSIAQQNHRTSRTVVQRMHQSNTNVQ